MKPFVGRTVHYVSYGTPDGGYGRACRAAVVTSIPDQWLAEIHGISLAVLNPAGLFFDEDVHYDEGESLKRGETRMLLCGGREYAGGTWHWPARVPGDPL